MGQGDDDADYPDIISIKKANKLPGPKPTKASQGHAVKAKEESPPKKRPACKPLQRTSSPGSTSTNEASVIFFIWTRQVSARGRGGGRGEIRRASETRGQYGRTWPPRRRGASRRTRASWNWTSWRSGHVLSAERVQAPERAQRSRISVMKRASRRIQSERGAREPVQAPRARAPAASVALVAHEASHRRPAHGVESTSFAMKPEPPNPLTRRSRCRPPATTGASRPGQFVDGSSSPSSVDSSLS